LFGILPDAIDAPRALDEADDSPWQVEIYHDGRVLKILAFAEDIGSYKDAEFIGGLNFFAGHVALGAETLGEPGGIFSIAGHAGELFHLLVLQLITEVSHGIGELGEDDYFLAGMLFREKLVEFVKLAVPIGLPFACELQDGEKPLRILSDVLGKIFDKHIGAEPVE
jgi:hypothetical protein